MVRAVAWSPHGTLDGLPLPGEPAIPPAILAAAEVSDLGTERVQLAWEMARLAGADGAGEAEARAVLLLALSVLAAQRDGSTRVPLGGAGDALGAPLRRLLRALGAGAEDEATIERVVARARGGEAAAALAAVLGVAGDYRPLLVADEHLYAQRSWQLEQRVVEALSTRLVPRAIAGDDAVEAALADVRERPARDAGGRPVPLSGEQEEAVRRVLRGRLGVLTGGPGTGKTWVMAALLRVVARLGEPRLDEIALAAPTGKATDRLGSAIAAALRSVERPAEADRRLLATPPRASTLHRLLSYSPAGELFRHHERNPLPDRLVIVDESSMVDLALAERLLRATRADATLLFVGDARQLPSVDAGAVFRDLVDAAPSALVARLTRSWRMDPADPAGSAILGLANGVAGGAVDAATLALRERADAIAFTGAELLLTPPATIAEFLAAWWRQRVLSPIDWRQLVSRQWSARDGFVSEEDAPALATLMRHHESSRLLTATRGWSGGTGAAALHEWFRAALRHELGTVPVRGGDEDEHPVGEPVLVVRNDYRRALFNGDQGLVLHVASDGEPPQRMVVLRSGERFRVFPLASLRGALEPAWASTVHKAQGSEHDHVAVVLPVAETRLLTRELLYTAITRARRSVVLVGTLERLEAAAGRAVERWSGIAAGLRTEVEASQRVASSPPVLRQQLGLPFGD